MLALDKIVGQTSTKKTIQILLESSKLQNTAFPHCIFLGPSGCGKTLLANCIAQELSTKLHVHNAAKIKKDGVLSCLNDLKKHDVLFIDEVHNLDVRSQESLYDILDHGRYTIQSWGIVLDIIDFPPFTLIAATTAAIKPAMLNRFRYQFELEEYSDKEIAEIIQNQLTDQGFTLDPIELSKYCRGNPRVAGNMLDWIKNYAIVHNIRNISYDQLTQCLNYLHIGPLGLTEQDIQYLKFLYDAKKPVGIASISGYLGVDKSLVEQKIEPYLMRRKLIYKTSSGRVVNRKSYESIFSKHSTDST